MCNVAKIENTGAGVESENTANPDNLITKIFLAN